MGLPLSSISQNSETIQSRRFGSDAHTMRHQQQFKNFYVVAGILNLTEDDLCDLVRE